MLTLCVLNIAAASASTPTTATHNRYNTDTTDQQTTTLVIRLMNNNGDEIVTANVNQTVNVVGVLMAGTLTPNFIGGAKVNTQLMKTNGTWTTISTTTTETGQYKGMFAAPITPTSTGAFSYRATYNGDSQYAPTVSNVVTLTIT
jgi:hypothetical protein